MKTFKSLLLILAISLMSSCASFQLVTHTPQVTYGFDYYDYNTIHHLYISNPHYFYNNFYLDQYGTRRHYYNHPYFTRYCNTRNIRPNHRYYVNNRSRKVHMNGRRGNQPTPIIQNSTTRRIIPINNNRTTRINNNRTTRINNNRTTQESNNRTTRKSTIRRASPTPRVNIRTTPTRRRK